MSFVLRFVDKGGETREEFLGFLHCELGLSGKGLAETVLTEIGNLTSDFNNCRGQGYDGHYVKSVQIRSFFWSVFGQISGSDWSHTTRETIEKIPKIASPSRFSVEKKRKQKIMAIAKLFALHTNATKVEIEISILRCIKILIKIINSMLRGTPILAKVDIFFVIST